MDNKYHIWKSIIIEHCVSMHIEYYHTVDYRICHMYDGIQIHVHSSNTHTPIEGWFDWYIACLGFIAVYFVNILMKFVSII